MFVSLPEFRFPLPVGLAQPGAQYWRALTTTTNSAWYIMKVKVAGEDGGVDLRTMLLWWDRDVLETIEQLRPLSIDSLVCVLPTPFEGARKRRGQTPSINLKEVWLAHDPEGPETLTPLFVDEHGAARMGLLAEEIDSPPSKLRLVGRVGTGLGASTANA